MSIRIMFIADINGNRRQGFKYWLNNISLYTRTKDRTVV